MQSLPAYRASPFGPPHGGDVPATRACLCGHRCADRCLLKGAPSFTHRTRFSVQDKNFSRFRVLGFCTRCESILFSDKVRTFELDPSEVQGYSPLRHVTCKITSAGIEPVAWSYGAAPLTTRLLGERSTIGMFPQPLSVCGNGKGSTHSCLSRRPRGSVRHG